MSLTSQLRDPNSPVARFFAENFPDHRGFASAWSKRVRLLPTIRPEGATADYPWPLVGAALDYRIRVCWEAYPAESTVAALGGGEGGYLPISSDGLALLWANLSSRWNAMMDCIAGRDRCSLRADLEDALARMSMALAAFEAVFRSGQLPEMLSRALGEPGGADELLRRIPDAVVADLVRLIDGFAGSDHRYLHPRSIVLNPTFDGSSMVGGADADVILDQILWDFKATIRPERTTYWPYQLLGYGLLDFGDRFRLEGAGIYLARQKTWVSWSWPELMDLLGMEGSWDIQEWRGRFAAHLLGGRQWRGAGAIDDV